MEASLAVVLISPLSQQDLTTQDTSRLIGFRIDLCEKSRAKGTTRASQGTERRAAILAARGRPVSLQSLVRGD